MRFAADRAGVDMATFDMSMQRAGRRIGEFIAVGRGEAAPILEAMGFTREQLKTMGSIEDIMPQIADKIAGIEDPMVRNAVAMKLFDSEGVKLVQLMDQGAEGMEKMREEARKLGGVIGADSAKAAEVFKDKMTNMKAALSGVRNTIGSALLPAFNRLLQAFSDLIVENGPQIKAFAEAFAENLPEVIGMLITSFKVLAAILGPIVSVMGFLAEHTAFFETAALVLAGVLAFKLIVALKAAAVAAKLLALAFLGTPIGLIIAGITALVAVGLTLVKNWDKIVGWWKGIWEKIKNDPKAAIMDLVKFIIKWSPFGIMLRSANKLVEFLTGMNLGSVIESNLPDWAKRFLGMDQSAAGAGPIGGGPAGVAAGEAGAGAVKVQVDFSNLPKGVNTQTDASSDVDLTVDQGFALGTV
jgi:hypothetical protein